MSVAPNNYPFYNEDEKYVPVMQADGGQLSGEPNGQHHIRTTDRVTVAL